jgi:RES domain-containing protein
MAARNARPPSDFLPRDVCTIRIELERVLDLRTLESLRGVGLDPASIRGGDMLPSQRVGDAAHKLGFEGVLAPSATGIGETLVVFELKLRKESRVVQRARATWHVLSDLPRL